MKRHNSVVLVSKRVHQIFGGGGEVRKGFIGRSFPWSRAEKDLVGNEKDN